MNRRLDIYLNGTHGLKEVAGSMVTSWGDLPDYARSARGAFTALLWAMLELVGAVLSPLLVVLAPLLALVLAHRVLGEDDDDMRIQGVFDREEGAS